MNNLIDKKRVSARVEDIKTAVLRLKEFQNMSLNDFMGNGDNYAVASYYLRIAIEGVLTVATHILSRIPTNGKKKDYTQTILSLADYNVLPERFAKKIKGMAGFRNRMVHLYWKVDSKEILNVINDDLKDFDEFIKYINNFLKKG